MLSEKQQEIIIKHLKEAKLTYTPLEEELLDHLCCAIEEKMETGLSFSAAKAAAFEVFTEDEIQKTERQTIFLINQKKMFMKQLTFLLFPIVVIYTYMIGPPTFDPPSTSPVQGEWKLTSGFGMRMHPVQKEKKMHKGIDIAVPIGTPIHATASGLVEIATFKKGYGNYIKLRHDDAYQSAYSQLSEILVAEGDQVQKGDIIAYSGNSGTSTGPHLHYEVIKDGKHVNPKDYLKP